MSAFDDILNEADDDEEVTEAPPGDESTATAGDEADDAEPTVEAPVAETVAEEEAEPVEGYKQDARGVWHRPDGTIASKDEVAKLATESPPDPVAVPETPAVTEAPPTPAVPFRYRAAAATHELPGASFDPVTGRVIVEGEGVSAIRQALNAQHLLPQYQSRVADLEKQVQTRGPAEAKADALAERLTQILAHENEEEAITAFFELRQNWPVMMAKTEADYYRQLAEGGRIPQQQAPQQEQAQSALPAAEVALSTTNEYVEQLKLESEFRALTDADWQQIGDSLARTPYAFIRPAGQADAEQYGVAVGELVFDTDALAGHIQTYQQRTQVAREADAARRKAQEAAKFNAAQSKPAVAKPLNRRAVPALAATATNKPKDWDSSFKSAWSNDDDDDMN